MTDPTSTSDPTQQRKRERERDGERERGRERDRETRRHGEKIIIYREKTHGNLPKLQKLKGPRIRMIFVRFRRPGFQLSGPGDLIVATIRALGT
jgi:hypothetical protein